MNYGNQAGQASNPTPRDATLNERLNRAYESLQSHCDRLESVLSRVNGTPTAAPSNMKEVAQIRPPHPLSGVVEMMEQTSARLASLTEGVERIA